MIKRLDPSGCACIDCLTGYSKPMDEASDEEIALAALGIVLQDATSGEAIIWLNDNGPNLVKDSLIALIDEHMRRVQGGFNA